MNDENSIKENESLGSRLINGIKPIDESQIIQTIVLGSDWQEVLSTIVIEEGLDPLNINIIKLADSFKNYMNRLTDFSFRIPARFILIAAILLRMKCEMILEGEEEKKQRITQSMPNIDINNIPSLEAPISRKTTKRVTLDELIGALNKAFEFKEKKEDKKIRLKRAVENLIEPEEDIEVRISRIYNKIIDKKITKFSELVPVWKNKEIVEFFLPILHLCVRSKIYCNQEEMFKEIYITIRDNDASEKGV